jgi:hypothetical protein
MSMKRLAALAIVTVLALTVTACSDGVRDSAPTGGGVDRSAFGFYDLYYDDSGRQTSSCWQNTDKWTAECFENFPNQQGDRSEPVNVDDWCLPAQDDTGKAGFGIYRNITACVVMKNETRRFASPGTLGDGWTFPLGVTRAKCGANITTPEGTDPNPISGPDGKPMKVLDETCLDTASLWGRIRSEGVNASNVTQKGVRFTYPNPFYVSAAVQYQPNSIWQGTEAVTFVGSPVAPFSLSPLQEAEVWVNIPTKGENAAKCTPGRFLSCEQVGTTTEDSQQRFTWIFRTRPMVIGIKNNSGFTMEAIGDPVVGSGFLVDPRGTTADLSSLPNGSQSYVGGYRATSVTDSQTWTGTYRVRTSQGEAQIIISIKLSYVPIKDSNDKPTGQFKVENESQCKVQALKTIRLTCDTPVPTNDDNLRKFDVLIRNY